MERTKNQYNLRNRPGFKPLTYVVSFIGPKIWNIVPEEFKYKKSLNSFKESIKMWVPTNCPCRLCRVYLDGVGFINRI